MVTQNPYSDEELIRRAVAAVKRYRGHPEWEDLRQEACLGAFRSVQYALRSGRCHWTLAATLGARRAVVDYLFPRKQRKGERRGEKPVAPLSLETLIAESVKSDGWEPSVPDTAPEIVETIGFWQAVRCCCSDREWEFLDRVYLRGQSQSAAAKALGKKKSWPGWLMDQLRPRLKLALEKK